MVDYEADTEESLHKKIIMLYEIIEKRTVENIQIKKENDEIKVRTEAYQEVINFVKVTSALSCEKN